MDNTAVTRVHTGPRNGGRRRQWVAAGVAAVALLVAWCGYTAGTHRSQLRWHTGTAYSTEWQIATQVDGWWYSIPLDVEWEDAGGSQHGNGRPDCLPPTGQQTKPVRFAEVTVKVRGGGWRQVVFVSCKT